MFLCCNIIPWQNTMLPNYIYEVTWHTFATKGFMAAEMMTDYIHQYRSLTQS